MRRDIKDLFGGRDIDCSARGIVWIGNQNGTGCRCNRLQQGLHRESQGIRLIVDVPNLRARNFRRKNDTSRRTAAEQ